MNSSKTDPQFVICIENEGYDASLEKRKVYRVLPDDQAAAHNMIRVVDESGEDYLFPSNYFLPIALPQPVIDALSSAA